MTARAAGQKGRHGRKGAAPDTSDDGGRADAAAGDVHAAAGPDPAREARAAARPGAPDGPDEDAAGERDDKEHPHAEPDPMDHEDVTDPRDEEIAQLHQRLARALADYQNLERRVAREAEAERERNRARLLEPFLHVYEYGRLAALEAERHPGPLADGIRMVVREFERVLEAEGVRLVGAVGDAFDQDRHEAVAEEAADGVPPGRVTRVVAPGYMLGDRVLRYAKVAVAPPDDAPPAPGVG